MNRQFTPIAFRRIVLGIIITALLFAAWKLPILESVAGIAVLEPSAVWFVRQDGGGQIVTGWESNLLGGGGEQAIIEFERTDVVRVELFRDLKEGSRVAPGDTIAEIRSIANESIISDLEGQLELARASLAALQEGLRPVDISVAEQEVKYAEASLEAFKPEFERAKELHEKGFLALDLFQVSEGSFKVLTAAKELAVSNYEATKAGARQVDLDIAAKEILRLENMLDFARQRHELRRALLSPISGVIKIGETPGYFVKIIRTDTLAAFVSLPETMLSDIKSGGRVTITLAIGGRTVSGIFDRLSFRQLPTPGSFVVAFIDNSAADLSSGMHGHAEVETKPRSLLSSINRTLNARLR